MLKDYGFEFLLFWNSNPLSCPVIDITEIGNPHSNLIASETDLRIDLSKYCIFKDGKFIDGPIDIEHSMVPWLLCAYSWS